MGTGRYIAKTLRLGEQFPVCGCPACNGTQASIEVSHSSECVIVGGQTGGGLIVSMSNIDDPTPNDNIHLNATKSRAFFPFYMRLLADWGGGLDVDNS